MAHTDAITTAGHNISNANTEGYSRQRVQLKEFDPLYKPDLERAERAGMIGQGMDSQQKRRAYPYELLARARVPREEIGIADFVACPANAKPAEDEQHHVNDDDDAVGRPKGISDVFGHYYILFLASLIISSARYWSLRQ